MKRTNRRTTIGYALACGPALTPSAHPGGIILYEIATPDVGLASAGYAARAEDPSTLFTNPAGMSLLPGSQFQVGAQLNYGTVEFSPNAGTGPLLGTESGGNAGRTRGRQRRVQSALHAFQGAGIHDRDRSDGSVHADGVSGEQDGVGRGIHDRSAHRPQLPARRWNVGTPRRKRRRRGDVRGASELARRHLVERGEPQQRKASRRQHCVPLHSHP